MKKSSYIVKEIIKTVFYISSFLWLLFHVASNGILLIPEVFGLLLLNFSLRTLKIRTIYREVGILIGYTFFILSSGFIFHLLEINAPYVKPIVSYIIYAMIQASILLLVYQYLKNKPYHTMYKSCLLLIIYLVTLSLYVAFFTLQGFMNMTFYVVLHTLRTLGLF